MTRQEQAAFKRLEKRRRELFMGLAIIKTWITMPDNPKDVLYRVAKLCTERLEADREADKKEQRA